MNLITLIKPGIANKSISFIVQYFSQEEFMSLILSLLFLSELNSSLAEVMFNSLFQIFLGGGGEEMV